MELYNLPVIAMLIWHLSVNVSWLKSKCAQDRIGETEWTGVGEWEYRYGRYSICFKDAESSLERGATTNSGYIQVHQNQTR